MRYALPLSIVLHLLLLLLFTGGAGDSRKKDDKPADKPAIESIKIKIVEKPAEKAKPKAEPPKEKTKSKVVKTVEKKPMLPAPELIVVEHKCDEFYAGVGYTNTQNGVCKVVSVPRGYPADRAGMLPGDLVINPAGGECPGRGPIGTTITITVMRGSQVHNFYMVREKICSG